MATRKRKAPSVTASRLEGHVYKTHDYKGNARTPPVPTLQGFMRRYGTGEEGRQRRLAFCKRVGTSINYITQVGNGLRRCGEGMAIRIERESHGLVRLEELRPDIDWAYFETRKRRAA